MYNRMWNLLLGTIQGQPIFTPSLVPVQSAESVFLAFDRILVSSIPKGTRRIDAYWYSFSLIGFRSWVNRCLK